MAKTYPHILTLLLTLTLLATAACQRRTVALAYSPTSVEGWEPGDTLTYHIDTLSRAGRYSLSLGIRTSASTPYPFQTLWLVIRQHWHAPEHITSDTLEVRLTDDMGDVNGSGVSLYEYHVPFRTYDLPAGASADITIHHVMQREMLPGVAGVGIRLERVNQ